MKAKLLNLLLISTLATVWGQEPPKQITWIVDRTDSIGGFPVTVSGQPQIVEKEGDTAVEFDGEDDGLIVDNNPMIGAVEFTIEVIFMVYDGGATEQRFVHFQQDDANRILVELRKSASDKWFLDTFIKSGSSSHTLYSEGFDHEVNKWNHIGLVYKDNKMTHYVEGVEELSGDVTYSEVSSGQTSLGVRLNKVSWFKGAIRLVRVTHKALSPEQFIINETQDTSTTDTSTTSSDQNPAPSLMSPYPPMYLGELSTGLPESLGEIMFSVNKPGTYTIAIFNTIGKKQSIFGKYLEPGSYTAIIDIASLAAGQYFYMLSNSQDKITKTFILK